MLVVWVAPLWIECRRHGYLICPGPEQNCADKHCTGTAGQSYREIVITVLTRQPRETKYTVVETTLLETLLDAHFCQEAKPACKLLSTVLCCFCIFNLTEYLQASCCEDSHACLQALTLCNAIQTLAGLSKPALQTITPFCVISCTPEGAFMVLCCVAGMSGRANLCSLGVA